MTTRIVFLDRETLAPSVVLRRPVFPHVWSEYPRTAAGDVAARGAEADILVTNKVPLRHQVLDSLPRLRMVAVAATGVDMIDVDACRARGIVVSNIRGYAARTVPEHTFALILALRRNLLAYHRAVANGRWQENGLFCFFDFPIADLAGARLGIVGEGVIGQGVAALARAFAMTPQFAAHKGATGMGPLYTPWAEVLETSDIITLHCPLTDATRHMIGWPEFRAMRRRPLLINTARGGLVDETALARALDAGLISGAGFDVSEGEPPAVDSPLLRLLDRPDVLLTPHVAWASRDAMQTLADQLIDNIEAFVAGAPVNRVC